MKAQEWGVMATKLLAEELVGVRTSITARHHLLSFASEVMETLEPQIKPVHYRNVSGG